jgi:hypothetical protein
MLATPFIFRESEIPRELQGPHRVYSSSCGNSPLTMPTMAGHIQSSKRAMSSSFTGLTIERERMRLITDDVFETLRSELRT